MPVRVAVSIAARNFGTSSMKIAGSQSANDGFGLRGSKPKSTATCEVHSQWSDSKSNSNVPTPLAASAKRSRSSDARRHVSMFLVSRSFSFMKSAALFRAATQKRFCLGHGEKLAQGNVPGEMIEST